MAYRRLSELDFSTKKHRSFCETLLLDIHRLESQIVYDDETVEYLRNTVGTNAADVAESYVKMNKRLLLALKLSFWYYTGANPSEVLNDVTKDQDEIDIFNPL